MIPCDCVTVQLCGKRKTTKARSDVGKSQTCLSRQIVRLYERGCPPYAYCSCSPHMKLTPVSPDIQPLQVFNQCCSSSLTQANHVVKNDRYSIRSATTQESRGRQKERVQLRGAARCSIGVSYGKNCWLCFPRLHPCLSLVASICPTSSAKFHFERVSAVKTRDTVKARICCKVSIDR